MRGVQPGAVPLHQQPHERKLMQPSGNRHKVEGEGEGGAGQDSDHACVDAPIDKGRGIVNLR